jgi:Predicted dehydrogenases and related proteins
MVKIGIIGCGKIAQLRHIPEFADNPNATVYGFFDANQDRCREIAAQYGGVAYESVEAMLADENIDAVSVITPNFTHASISIAALKQGKHVLCEKPMAVTLADCEEMAQVSEEMGKKLMIAHNQRFNSSHVLAKQLLEQGAIGEVISFRTSFAHSGADNWSVDGANSWFMDKSKSHFGAFADLGVHKTDLMVYLLGQRIARVSACIGTLNKRDKEGNFISVDDNAFCTYVMENGVMGTMNASWTNHGQEDNATSIYGTTGSMHIYRDPAHPIVIERSGGADEYYGEDAMQTNDNQTKSGVMDAFVRCIAEDTEPAVSAQSALAAMRAIFAGEESARKNSAFVEVL